MEPGDHGLELEAHVRASSRINPKISVPNPRPGSIALAVFRDPPQRRATYPCQTSAKPKNCLAVSLQTVWMTPVRQAARGRSDQLTRVPRDSEVELRISSESSPSRGNLTGAQWRVSRDLLPIDAANRGGLGDRPKRTHSLQTVYSCAFVAARRGATSRPAATMASTEPPFAPTSRQRAKGGGLIDALLAARGIGSSVKQRLSDQNR
jgi:hypothetical protein